MLKFGKGVVKSRFIIFIAAILLLIPSVFGYLHTRVNYDILSYLPEDIETMKGQDILVDEFGTGAFSTFVVDGMSNKDVSTLKAKIEQVDHVKSVLWYDSVADISIPTDMLPEKLQKVFLSDEGTLMFILYDTTMSADETMEAVEQIRAISNEQCFLSGMSAVVTDIRDLSDKEVPIYVVLAVILSLIVLSLTMDSFLIPIFFLLSIGMAIIYNLGTNVFMGEISYVTKALSAVLQLGVTMDYSIFLLNSYEENKLRFPGEKERAMGHAIANTFKSVVGSSVTTVAGFMALCFMTFALGKDLGIVMAKGVVMGVLCCVTLLPSLILIFDRAIEKTKHRPLIKSIDKPSAFITKHYRLWLILFAVLLFPAIYGNNHTKIYYNIAQSLPDTLPANVANKKLVDDFKMSNMHMILMQKDMDAKDKRKMLEEIDEVDGVKWSLGMNTLFGPTIPESMIPDDMKKMLQSDNYELAFICSEYESATDEVNKQISAIDKIVKSYSKHAMVIGEAPLMKDLQDTTDVDLKTVNAISILAIFIIIMVVFKSISLPFILVAVIEFAIFVNMSVPYYQGKEVVFVASIVIGTIQLGATVDYAILMTSRYQKERGKGKDKKTAISIAHRASMLSIISSGFSFFAATFGVALYSKVDMIGSICTLLARGGCGFGM